MMKLGVVVGYSCGDRNLDEKFAKLKEGGFSSCQLCVWRLNDDPAGDAEYVRSMCEKYGVTVSTLWCGWPGPCFWNFTEGPLTLGIVPPEYRFERINYLRRGIEYTAMLGVHQMATHAGFIPEDMNDPKYLGTIAALKSLKKLLQQKQVKFLFETGQETAITLLRVIETLGPEDFGVNLDTGNLVLYGKSNPVDATEILAKYVCDLHAKDGVYPTDGLRLGHEVPLGEGKADFHKILRILKDAGYDGTITIEREISGEQQAKDIQAAKQKLENILAEL